MAPAQILIADDHPLMRRGIKALLEMHPNWKVCAEAEDGQQALRKATETNPDVIILDLAMPVMDGLSAAKEIRKVLPKTLIVIHTVYKTQQSQIEAKKAGVHLLVSKGDDTAVLLNGIEALLDRDRAQLH
jgi:DNA-binding NarL/FixJ family response regulator